MDKSKIEYMDAQPFTFQAAKPQPITGGRDRLDQKIKEYAAAKGVSYVQAFNALRTEQPALIAAYRINQE